MPIAPLIFVMSACATPAVAEVCDKFAGDDWPSNPPAPGFFSWQGSAQLLAIVMFAVLMIVWLRSKTLAWVFAACAGLLTALIVTAPFLDDDDMTRAAIAEGCVVSLTPTGELSRVILFASLAVFFVWMARGRTLLR
ncbi:hypothetical protein [Methylorubrum suomiense]|uniref:Transmembrane protein n=1 Tax=Methylorubrum suomiense TaxID=144191 RepID=A0ABQ4UNI6_9HYPH|nr:MULTISPECIES: hypothetical protein [Methylobacteriaceae]GJE73520.1 hypothetical protein BGCPKDLD_0084 [Methylorubrum suomiense]